MTILIACYLLFAVPLIVRSLLLLGANIYRAGQTNNPPPNLLEMPGLPRFGVGTNGQARERDESDRLPSV